jgi:hypothetical protein
VVRGWRCGSAMRRRVRAEKAAVARKAVQKLRGRRRDGQRRKCAGDGATGGGAVAVQGVRAARAEAGGRR